MIKFNHKHTIDQQVLKYYVELWISQRTVQMDKIKVLTLFKDTTSAVDCACVQKHTDMKILAIGRVIEELPDTLKGECQAANDCLRTCCILCSREKV